MFIPSNYTDQEALDHFGPFMMAALAPERIERLVDIAGRIDPDALDARCLNDASASYPEEDFLQFAIDELQKMGKDELAEELDDLQNEVTGNAEYGRSVIRDYQQEVGKL